MSHRCQSLKASPVPPSLLWLRLQKSNSRVTVGGPRCSLRSGKVYSDSQLDYLKMTLLNLPAAVISLAL